MMKKFYHILLAAVALTMCVGCSEEEDENWNKDGKGYEFGPLELYIRATAGEHNLIYPSYEGNICNKVSVTYNGETYYYTPESKVSPKYFPATFRGLYQRSFVNRTDPDDPSTEFQDHVMFFGEFDFSKKYKNEVFYINWSDGKTDKVRWSHWLVWANDRIESRGDMFLNGKKMQGPFITREFK